MNFSLIKYLTRNIITTMFLVFLFSSCNSQVENNSASIPEENETPFRILNKSGETISTRFNPPKGYSLIKADSSSFATYLQKLPLKTYNSKVLYYNGEVKYNYKVYESVIKMDIDKQDLQQCADAVMRLKGEYLYGIKDYESIHFNFISDSKPRYYIDYAKGDYSYSTFRKYMRYIFSYANTASLYHELEKVGNYNDMQIGDVFVQKGRPYGHAVIVVNMAMNNMTGEKVFMLAQSYMPAQETQVLINRSNLEISPWYILKSGKVSTPEWEFSSSDLRRFKD